MENKMAKKEIPMPEEDNHSEIYDLSNRVCRSVVAVIDTLTQRGAFKGEELSTIGGLRDQSLRAIQLCETYQSERAGG